MIKVSNKDSIIDIIKKIESSKKNEIVLEFPIWNSILHNHTSLKILKNKVKNKNLVIVTNDVSAKKIWKNLWIKFSIIKDDKIIKNIDLLKYNYTFNEYLIFLIKSYGREFSNFFSKKKEDSFINSKYNKILKYKYTKNEKSRIWFFISWLIISILLLVFIFYFAVNKTYISITPEITIKTRAKNLIFREWESSQILENKNEIKLTKISKLVYLTNTFWTSWIHEDLSLRAKWEIIIYNHLNEDLTLVKGTRVETKEWIVYTTQEKVFIPPATTNLSCIDDSCEKRIPWEANIAVISKLHDNKWAIVWKKWNIKSWTIMHFPWLGSKLKDQIYAKTKQDFEWWTNEYEKTVGDNDIINAKKILEEKLKSKALKELKKQIQEDNKINNITYEILWIDKIIEYSDLQITWDEHIKVWDKKEKIFLSWTIKITTYLYNKELVINKLKSTIRENVLTDIENINFINDDSLRVSNVISRTQDPLIIKITAEIEVFYSHNFLSKTSNYVEKLKNTISWINKSDALKILINNTKISDVTIETRPFFIKKISKIPKNIIFKIKKN
jgi:hypothetical protein